MKKGSIVFVLLVVFGFVALVGGGTYVGAKKLGIWEKPRKLDLNDKKVSQDKDKAKKDKNSNDVEYPIPQTSPGTEEASPSPSASPSASVYKDPQGKFSLTLPADWVANSTDKASTYTTTKFTGPNGNISITYGTGKDPQGGCSETTSIKLFDRSIAGCFLMQKDGSQILTRAYTTDTFGVQFTIEAYFNAPSSTTRDAILKTIKTIDIN